MRHLPDLGFAGDDGSADGDLRQAMAAAATQGGSSGAALALLLRSRLLVPVVSVPDHAAAGESAAGESAAGESAAGEGGGVSETASVMAASVMAAVLMTGRDGRQALLAFSGIDALHRWNPEARPVPVPAAQAARAAVEEGASALVVDVAGPAMFVLEGDDLRHAAAGLVLVRVGAGYGWAGGRRDATTGPV